MIDLFVLYKIYRYLFGVNFVISVNVYAVGNFYDPFYIENAYTH